MWYKIVFKKNGNWSFSVFKYEDEAEKKTKLERWKSEHVNPYNKIEVIWHGLDEEYNYGVHEKKNNLSTDATI